LPHDERLLDLLALRAASGLNDADEALVASLDAGAFDDAAAVLAVGFSVHGGLDPLPDSLRQGLERLGRDLLAGRFTEVGSADNPSTANGSTENGSTEYGSIEVGPVPVAMIRPGTAGVPVVQRAGTQTGPAGSADPAESARVAGSGGWLGALGWLAAAACLALAVIGWSLPRDAPSLFAPQSAEALLASLENRPGIVRTSWIGLDTAGLSEAAHPYDRNLSGEVVWDPTTNEGYMVFEGLASNDPSQFQYQLWIFDETRPTGDLPHFGDGILSQRPVPGAVFDVTSDGRVVVPVQAKLPVGKAVIFAVTVEPPGGVVVSDRDIVTLAMVK
jgi:hypothetical protein